MEYLFIAAIAGLILLILMIILIKGYFNSDQVFMEQEPLYQVNKTITSDIQPKPQFTYFDYDESMKFPDNYRVSLMQGSLVRLTSKKENPSIQITLDFKDGNHDLIFGIGEGNSVTIHKGSILIFSNDDDVSTFNRFNTQTSIPMIFHFRLEEHYSKIRENFITNYNILRLNSRRGQIAWRESCPQIKRGDVFIRLLENIHMKFPGNEQMPFKRGTFFRFVSQSHPGVVRTYDFMKDKDDFSFGPEDTEILLYKNSILIFGCDQNVDEFLKAYANGTAIVGQPYQIITNTEEDHYSRYSRLLIEAFDDGISDQIRDLNHLYGRHDGKNAPSRMSLS